MSDDRCLSCKRPLNDKELRHSDKTCQRCSHHYVPMNSRYIDYTKDEKKHG
jgi:DNA-directed RNA polymerase subunit RPC12/RpoP